MGVKIDVQSTETLCFQLIADFLIFPLKEAQRELQAAVPVYFLRFYKREEIEGCTAENPFVAVEADLTYRLFTCERE